MLGHVAQFGLAYTLFFSEGDFPDFHDHISQDISICIWPPTRKADLRSSATLTEGRAGFAERGRANLVTYSQPPQASPFTCQALANLSGQEQREMNSS